MKSEREFSNIDEVIEEDNKWKFNEFGDSPPKICAEDLKKISRQIKIAKQKNIKLDKNIRKNANLISKYL